MTCFFFDAWCRKCDTLSLMIDRMYTPIYWLFKSVSRDKKVCRLNSRVALTLCLARVWVYWDHIKAIKWSKESQIAGNCTVSVASLHIIKWWILAKEPKPTAFSLSEDFCLGLFYIQYRSRGRFNSNNFWYYITYRTFERLCHCPLFWVARVTLNERRRHRTLTKFKHYLRNLIRTSQSTFHRLATKSSHLLRPVPFTITVESNTWSPKKCMIVVLIRSHCRWLIMW